MNIDLLTITIHLVLPKVHRANVDPIFHYHKTPFYSLKQKFDS